MLWPYLHILNFEIHYYANSCIFYIPKSFTVIISYIFYILKSITVTIIAYFNFEIHYCKNSYTFDILQYITVTVVNMFLHGLVSVPHIKPKVSVAVALQTCACRVVTGYWKFRRTFEDNIKMDLKKWGGKTCTLFICLRMWTSGGIKFGNFLD
jgi:hypothetical protein